jgi:hypothetical protein
MRGRLLSYPVHVTSAAIMKSNPSTYPPEHHRKKTASISVPALEAVLCR